MRVKKCGETEWLAQKSNTTSCGWTRGEQSWIPTQGLSHSATKTRTVPFIWSSLHAALRWHKTGHPSQPPKHWHICCCNPCCAKVAKKKVWAEGDQISAHASNTLHSSQRICCNTGPGEIYVLKNEQSWGLLAIFLNRLSQLHNKQDCAKEAGCSNTHDIRDLVKLRGRHTTLIGVYHFRWEGGFLTWGFFGLGSHGSYSCSGNLITAFLGFSNFAPSSVEPLSPHRTWSQESTL